MCAPQLARAGSGEEKVNAARLDQSVNLVQELGQTLNLIDRNQVIRGGQFLLQLAGIAAEGQEDGCVEKIVNPYVP